MSIDTSAIVKEVSMDLARKLKDEGEKVNNNTVTVITKTVVRELIQRREYPSTYTEEDILADLDNYYATILKVAEYDYNMIGVEGQKSHSENGVSRSYVDRDSLFGDVYKFVKIF